MRPQVDAVIKKVCMSLPRAWTPGMVWRLTLFEGCHVSHSSLGLVVDYYVRSFPTLAASCARAH